MSGLRAWLREPLLHFLLIGLAIFVLDLVIRGEEKNPRVVVIDETVRAELVALYHKGKGREPNAEEYEFLVNRWLYDEIMYREALALGLDKGDEMFRTRLELKLRSMLINSVVLEPPRDQDLRDWMAANLEQYTAPPRFDLAQFPVNGQIGGDDPGATAKALAAKLGDTQDEMAIPEDYEDDLRLYRNRSRENIAAVFGEAFTEDLLDGGNRAWRALKSEKGWHVAQLRAEKPQIDPDFEAIKAQLAADWSRYHNKRLAGEAFEDIRASYAIRREDLE